jgi:selenocysteine lyase/cysteine desulfurase
MGVTDFARPFRQPVKFQLKAGAERFQVGVWNLLGVVATIPGLDLLLDIGMAGVENYVLDLSGYCIEGLTKRGLEVITPTEAEQRGGIVSIQMADCVKVTKFMSDNDIDVHAEAPEQILRIDPHVFNNRDDIDMFLSTLDKYLAQR